MVYLLFSANTVTGKRTWSHPALPAWVACMAFLEISNILDNDSFDEI